MKKIGLIIAVVSMFAITAQAQKPVEPMQVGSWILNAGIGIGNLYDGGGSGFGTKAAIEIGVWEVGPGVISLGGEIGWANTSKSIFGYANKWKYNQFSLAARGAWHHGWGVEGLDTYGGIALGPAFQRASISDPTGTYSGNNTVIYFAGYVGASYFFTPNFGVNAELGYTSTLFQVGIAYKF